MQTVRKDGLRVVSKNLPHTKRTNLAVMVLAGSAYDPPGKDGLFHFFEHTAFQGTTRRSKEDISALLERHAFKHNARTGKLHTLYWSRTVRPHLNTVLELMLDMHQNPSFPESEFEREKNVIIHEVEGYNDDDDSQLYKGLKTMLYGKDHPNVKYGTGTKESVSLIERDDLLKLHPEWYIPSNTVVIGTGDVEHDELCSLVDTYLQESSRIVSHPRWDTMEDVVPNQKEFILERSHREKAMMVFGAKLKREDEKDKMRYNLLLRMIAQGSDSILHKEIREKRGYAYQVFGGVSGSEKLGYYTSFGAESSPKYLAELKELIPAIVLDHPLEKAHFERVKEGFIDSWLVEMEYPSDWEDLCVNHIISGREHELEDMDTYPQRQLDMLRSLTFEDVLEIRKIIRPEHLVQALLLPGKE